MIGWFVVGALSWTWFEYVLHRFVFHERKLGARLAEEHLAHHAKVSWFAPWAAKLTLAVPIVGVVAGLGWLAVGPGAVGLVGGLLSGWLAYEWLHRRLHTHGPVSAYGRWARRHHFHHHFADPRRNHGVTTPVWDLVFGTYTHVEQVVVPARQTHHLPWLCGPDGEIAPAVSADFAVGPRRAPQGA
jgi:sterol desaturase/sphingolipid hydroxylase (fatty acid hydroxylase superfamily)